MNDEIEIHQIRDRAFTVDDVVRLFRTGGYDDIVVIMPFGALRLLLDQGIKPIHPHMSVIPSESGGRRYIFEHYERIVDIRISVNRLGVRKRNKNTKPKGVSRAK